MIRCATLAFAFLTLSSSAFAQYAWKVVLPLETDTMEYVTLFVGAQGRFCTAAVQAFSIADTQFRLQMWRSNDGGLSWNRTYSMKDPSPSRPPLGFHTVSHLQQIDSMNAIVIGDSSLILRTFDAGYTWVRQDGSAIKPGGLWYTHFSDPLHGIVVGGKNVITTDDGGKNWTLAPFSAYAFSAGHCNGAGRYMLANLRTGKIYTTSDNWQSVDSTAQVPAPEGYRNVFYHWSFSSHGDTIFAGGFEYEDTSSVNLAVIYRSTNLGQSWVRSSYTDIPPGNAIGSLSSVYTDTMLAGTVGGYYVLLSTDAGLTWRLDSAIHPSTVFMINASSIERTVPGNVVACVYGALEVLAFGSATKSSVQLRKGGGNSFGFPNPTHRIASIQFTLQESRKAKVVLYDLRGNTVAEFGDGVYQAGKREVILDAYGLLPGVYFYRVIAGDESQSGSFIRQAN